MKSKSNTWKEKIHFGIFHPIKFIKKSIRKNKQKKKFVSKESYQESRDREERKILVYFNHYYNPKAEFPGKSSKQLREVRREIVQKCLDSLRSIPNTHVFVCGIRDHALVPIDIDFSHLENPAHIVYASIEKMFKETENYAYFINIEDDILMDKKIIENISDFDIHNENVRDLWHPNRLEREDGNVYCPDFIAKPGWIGRIKKFNGSNLRIGINPHSGIMILSRAKMRFAHEKVNLQNREIIIGYYMASAYANVNAPFNLYRSLDLEEHAVYHLDQWEVR